MITLVWSVLKAFPGPGSGQRAHGHELHSHHMRCCQTLTEQLCHLEEHLPIQKTHQVVPALKALISLPHISLT